MRYNSAVRAHNINIPTRISGPAASREKSRASVRRDRVFCITNINISSAAAAASRGIIAINKYILLFFFFRFLSSYLPALTRATRCNSCPYWYVCCLRYPIRQFFEQAAFHFLSKFRFVGPNFRRVAVSAFSPIILRTKFENRDERRFISSRYSSCFSLRYSLRPRHFRRRLSIFDIRDRVWKNRKNK